MPLLTISPPYDTLATVTQLTRTVLADYIQGIVPAPQGTVNTNGTALTWVSGAQFTYFFNGAPISINGIQNQIGTITSPTTAILLTSAGVQNGVSYVATIQTGEIFADTQPYVLPTINLGWRKLQKKLSDKGHSRLEPEVDIFNLPAITNRDPISQQRITWTGFFDGTSQQLTPFLPSDFISPLRLWERPSVAIGSVNFNRLSPMHPAPNGLRSKPKGSRNTYWDWRGDGLYFAGSLIQMDLRVRYSSYLPDIVQSQGGFGSTPVPILGSGDALAYYAAAEFVNPRGGIMGQTFEAKGDVAVDQLTNTFAKMQQRSSFSRKSWGRGRRRF